MPRTILPAEHDGRIACFVAERLNTLFHPPFTQMGIEQDGQIIAGIIFNSFTGNDIHVSVAGSRWTRRFLREMGQYLFDQLNVDRFTAITEKQNVVDIVYRLGGQKEGVIRNHFGPDRDGILLGVLRDEYRYRHGSHTIRAGSNEDGTSAG
ncbi:GNAT family N-acetyltransferase [Gluconobacter kondonii]|uniref:GNAT family N-acetyltransferase n=1 Tax=Gluconobacter kondonii TaxID=941463 RepID=UPI001B8C7098|nr:GNAT family protein [Gluconobacter kondonii]MBS1082332.1 GNAT family N-acetyltransferase [Gluconobacter kondonii]